MAITTLIVEDEIRIRTIIKEYFEEENHTVLEAENGRIALELFTSHQVDLVILDIMLPELNGWSVCRKIREKSDVPIIILTANSDERDKLLGFELGADDYVTKPFSPKVLVASATNLLKRVNGTLSSSAILIEGDLEIQKSAYMIKAFGQPIPFTPKEYEMLIYLIENKKQVITREMFLNKIWGYDYYGDYRIIDAHIKKIRKKLGACAHYIVTVLLVGYKFEVK